MFLPYSEPSSAGSNRPLYPDLNLKSERERLSQPGLKGFFHLMEQWGVRHEDARVLLGGVSNGPYYAWKKDTNRTLDTDVLTRISYLLGICKALRILYGEKLADEWMKLPNTNLIFRGRTPLEYILRGGIPAMQILRRLLDARRGGV